MEVEMKMMRKMNCDGRRGAGGGRGTEASIHLPTSLLREVRGARLWWSLRHFIGCLARNKTFHRLFQIDHILFGKISP